MARKEARDYCRRCLAVMVCCVLVFSLTVRVTPRAKAVVAESAAILGIMADSMALAGGAGSYFYSDPTSASIGQLALICSENIKIDSGVFYDAAASAFLFDPYALELGAKAMNYLFSLDDGVVTEWATNIVSEYRANGGLNPGDSFTVPPEVQAALRAWSGENLAFDAGIMQYEDAFLYGANGAFVLSKVDWPLNSGTMTGTIQNLGSVFPVSFPEGIDLTQSYTDTFHVTDDFYLERKWQYNGNFSGWYSMMMYFGSRSAGVMIFAVPKKGSLSSMSSYINEYLETQSSVGVCGFLSMSKDGDYYCLASRLTDGRASVSGSSFVPVSEIGTQSVTTTITALSEDDATPTSPVTVTVPSSAMTTTVNGYSVPLMDVISPGVLTQNPAIPDDPAIPTAVPGAGITAGEITDAITDALPITGSIAGDAVVGDVIAEPDSLGAVFISKFPFCIPFDIIKAFQLLAAQPVTPRWEVDFMAPLEGVGGFHAQGDTTIVIDFERLEFMGVVCRWTCMVGFIIALAMGTKKLIWTA